MEALRLPDSFCIYLDGKVIAVKPGEIQNEVNVGFGKTADGNGLEITAHAEDAFLRLIRLRWNFQRGEELTPENGFDAVRVFSEGGDGLFSASFHGIKPELAMPFYFLITNGSDLAFKRGGLSKKKTVGIGLKSSPAVFCFWQLDSFGFTLWLDFRSGSAALHLKNRKIRSAIIVCEIYESVSCFSAAKQFCAKMCNKKLESSRFVYGIEYSMRGEAVYAIKSTKENASALYRMTRSNSLRPHMILSQENSQLSFTELRKLSSYIKSHGSIPGYIYNLSSANDIRMVRRPDGKTVLDISNENVRKRICDDMRDLIYSGFRFIGIDFNSIDLLGSDSGPVEAMTPFSDFKLCDDGKTSVEIIRGLLLDIRQIFDEECDKLGGDVNFCIFNAVPHLCVGLANIIGSRVSTKKNDMITTVKEIAGTLVPTLLKNGPFGDFAIRIPFLLPASSRAFTYRYIGLMAKSGLAFIVSYDIENSSGVQIHDLSRAFSTVCTLDNDLIPLDFTENSLPTRWIHSGREFTFRACGDDGFDYCNGWKI